MSILKRSVRPAIVLTLLLTLMTGFIYPGIVTVIAQVIFPYQAHGSLHVVNGKVIGSDLIGQQWTSPKYFHGRPSVTGYAADNTSGSNLGPTNSALIVGNGSQVTIAAGTPVPTGGTPVAGKPNTYDVPGTYLGVQAYADQFRKENGLAPNAQVPVDMVTASASGIDPDISIEGALLQVNRVAQARGMSPDAVKALVSSHIHDRFLWVFGEPYISVLELNLALDGQK